MGFFTEFAALRDTGSEGPRPRETPMAPPSSAVTPADEAKWARSQSVGATKVGIVGTAQVLAVGPSSGMVNNDPILPVDLLITMPGRPPRPVSESVVVPAQQVPRLVPGAMLPITVSLSHPAVVTINWAIVGD